MARRARQVVVVVVAGLHVAAFGLEGNQRIPCVDGGEVEGAITEQRVRVWGAPSRDQVSAQGVG